MPTSGSHFRQRHFGVGSRDTHQLGGFAPAVPGLPFAEARDGEQTTQHGLSEDSVGQAQLQADVVIANVVNVAGTVVIDDNGIVISDGALTFQDQYGSNVLTGAGFGASWLDFISSGFYNDHFAIGTTADIVAATIVGTASTDADYLASLSVDLPYWVVTAETGAGTLKRVADSTAVGGFALQWSGTEDATIMQDIPVIPGQRYAVATNWRYTNSASGFDVSVSTDYRKSDHSSTGSGTLSATTSFSTSQAAYAPYSHIQCDAAPADARYLRVKFTVARTSGSPTVWVNSFFAPASYQFGNFDVFGDLNVGAYGAVADFTVTNNGTNGIAWMTGGTGAGEWGYWQQDILFLSGSPGAGVELRLYSEASGTERGLISHDGQTLKIGNITTGDTFVPALLVGANASNALLGFYGASPVVRVSYGAPTGTATRTTFATGSVTLPQLAERVKALIDDFRTNGLLA